MTAFFHYAGETVGKVYLDEVTVPIVSFHVHSFLVKVKD